MHPQNTLFGSAKDESLPTDDLPLRVIMDFFQSRGWNKLNQIMQLKLEESEPPQKLKETELYQLLAVSSTQFEFSGGQTIIQNDCQIIIEDIEPIEKAPVNSPKSRNTVNLQSPGNKNLSNEALIEKFLELSHEIETEAIVLSPKSTPSNSANNSRVIEESSSVRSERLEESLYSSVPEKSEMDKDGEPTHDIYDIPYYVPITENESDDWVDDDDCGYLTLRVKVSEFGVKKSWANPDKHLIEHYDFDEEAPKDDDATAVFYQHGISCPDSNIDMLNSKEFTKNQIAQITQSVHIEQCSTEELSHLMEIASSTIDSYNLKVVYEVEKTGFEPNEDFEIIPGIVIAARYQILEYLGSAAFSRAVKCLDLNTGNMVCIKIVRNKKSYIDQSLDEIKLLRIMNSNDPSDKNHIVRLFEHFYYKEHLFLCMELLKYNLYDFMKYHQDNKLPNYYTAPRLRRISRQILQALSYLHSLNIIHCDLKPENILLSSISMCNVKLIDFGSSCFTNDFHTSYVQSRSYRAPEVIIGFPYGFAIDVWSVGCIVSELFTGTVLFQNTSIQTLLARMTSILGPIPVEMLKRGIQSQRFYTKDFTLYEERTDQKKIKLYYPKSTSLAHRLRTPDEKMYSFVRSLLRIHPSERPTASEALLHPWLQEEDDEDIVFYEHAIHIHKNEADDRSDESEESDGKESENTSTADSKSAQNGDEAAIEGILNEDDYFDIGDADNGGGDGENELAGN